MRKELLVVGAHSDDESLGAGGVLACYSDRAHVLCLGCDENRAKEFADALTKLGVTGRVLRVSNDVDFSDDKLAKEIEDEICRVRPTWLITHFRDDYHPDHRATARLVWRAAEFAGHITSRGGQAWRVSALYEMEISSLLPDPTFFVDISATIDKKLSAIRAHASQNAKAFQGGDYYLRLSERKASLRGLQAGVPFAEAFRAWPLVSAGPFFPSPASPYLPGDTPDGLSDCAPAGSAR